MNKTDAFLEEDCDYSVFIQALGYTPIFADRRYNGEAPLRDYPSYDYDVYLKNKNAKRELVNNSRRERHEALTSLSLNRVVGAMGGVYYE